MTQKVLAYDLGGTKVAVGVVNSHGTVIEHVREPILLAKGKAAVFRQLSDLGKSFLRKHPQIRRVGIASAGPLHPARGELLDPTNFSSASDQSWGKVPIVRILERSLKRKIILENDAAAAILAERWIGAARDFENAMILTLGTGLGTGIVCNGALLRSGRGLHPEAGHIILNHDDATAPCGCGNFGCAEAYLSGVNFTRRAQRKLNGPSLSSIQIADLARSGHPMARSAFDEYAWVMAVAIQSYVAIYSPEIVVFAGSFASAADLFLTPAKTHLKKLLKRRRVGIDLMPKLTVSTLGNHAGVIGGAYVAFSSRRQRRFIC